MIAVTGLLKVIHLVVAKDQTYGVPGRFIGGNVAFRRDVVDYAALSNVRVALLSLDQEKAFDRVDWDFMRATLLKMGFGPSFLRWVDLSKVVLMLMAIFLCSIENTLASWKGHSLSYRGRTLVINALALSRVWYVASLVHTPPWVSSDLCKLAFDLFWKGKRDVVPSSVIVEPTFAGSFNVFDVKLKVWFLIVQWASIFLFPTGFVLFLVLLLFMFCQVRFALILGLHLRFIVFFCWRGVRWTVLFLLLVLVL